MGRQKKKKFSLNVFDVQLKHLLRFFLSACFITYFFAPEALTFLIASNFVFASLIFLMRLKYLPGAKNFSNSAKGFKSQRAPFVSIHVPICNEPVSLVLKTLKSLEELDYPNYEVVVLSNNTENSRLWKPLRAYCKKKSLFKFKHVSLLKGFKAGALNCCLKLSDPRSVYIMTVDADYCLEPQILHQGVSTLESRQMDFLQFPQAYSNGSRLGDPLESEYAHFFQIFLRDSVNSNATLLTGTLSLIKKKCLDEIGGWSEESVTEDAKTSLDLIKAGFKGTYDHRLVGRGVMPTDLPTLRKQRDRWALGNAQTLFSISLRDLRRLGVEKSRSILLQLTAWMEFMFIPVVYLAARAIDGWSSMDLIQAPPGTDLLAGITIFLALGLKFLFFVSKLWPVQSVGKITQIYLVHCALALESNLGWVKSLGGKTREFIKTNKFFSPSKLVDMGAHLSLAMAMACLSALLFFKSQEMTAFAPLTIGLFAVAGALLLQTQFKNMNNGKPFNKKPLGGGHNEN